MVILLSIAHAAQGQCPLPPPLLQNGDFENLAPNCGSVNGNLIDGAFNLGCVNSWQSAFGTPSICLSNPSHGDYFACIGTNSEAIFQDLDICPGETYQLTFRFRTINASSTPSNLNVYLANGLIPVTATTNPPGMMPIDPSWQVLGNVQASNTTWQTATMTFTTNNLLNNQLVFVIQDGSSLPFGIDEVALTCITPLPLEITCIDIGNNTIHFEANMPAGITGCWDFGDGTTANGGNMINHTYATADEYTVCLTALCGCFIRVCKIIIIDPPPPPACPCTEANTLNIVASNQGSLWSALESFYNYDQNDDGIIDDTEHHDCIAISGRLIIDRDITITGCANIRMQPCSEIIVNGPVGAAPARHLNLEYNNIYGCVQMWRSITVSPHGRLTFRHNTIADAEYALQVQPSTAFTFLYLPTQVDIQDNRFERNHIGLFIPGNGGGFYGGNVWQTPFVGNNMLCKGPGNSLADLLPPCNVGLANYDVEYGYAGVAALGANFNVGTAGGAYNTFSNLRNGVIGERIFLNVSRSNFNNMIGFLNFQEPTFGFSEGVGVLARGGTNTVRDANFNQAGHAVYSSNSLLSMQRNSTTKVHFGLELRKPVSLSFTENADINFLDFGIRAWDLIAVPGYSSYIIDDNVFKTQDVQANSDGDWAIQLINSNAVIVPEGSSQISRNEMYIDDQVGGLLIDNINAWPISDNRVEFSAHTNGAILTGAGIFLQNSSYNYLYSNDILDVTGIDQNATTGLFTAMGLGNRFCCNSTEGSFVGSAFLGLCNDTRYRTTGITRHGFALFCSPGTTTGDQPIQFPGLPNATNSNQFNSTSGTAYHGGDDFQIGDSEFFVTNTLTPNWPEAIFTPNATAPWFTSNTASAFECVNDLQCPDPGLYEREERDQLELTDMSIAQNAYDSSPFGAALQWEGARDLYARMKANPEMSGQAVAVDAFYSQAATGAIGAFYDADQALENVTAIPEAWAGAMATAMTAIEQNRQEVETKLAELATAATRIDSLEVYWSAESIRTEAQEAEAVILEQQSQIEALRQTQAQAALALINALPAADVLQANRKTVQRVYLETTASGAYTLSPTQFSDISAIAHQCPLEGGSAVYLARGLYQLNANEHFDDFSLCSIAVERNAPQQAPSRSGVLTLQPNPASGLLRISVADMSGTAAADVQIIEPAGRIALSRHIVATDGILYIDVSSLPAGIYFCQVQLEGRALMPSRLVIAH